MLNGSIIRNKGITINYNVTFDCTCALTRRAIIQQTKLIFVQLA